MATDESGRTEAAEAEDSRRPASSETSPSPEHPSERQLHAPDATQQAGDREPGGRDQESAETQTRDDYAEKMRDQGAPIPPEDDSSPDDTHDREEQHSRAGEPRADTSGQDQGDPRDRETYADDMRRAEPIDADPMPQAAEDQAPTDALLEADFEESDTGQAESRSREEYADAMREGGDPLADGTGQPDAPEAGQPADDTIPAREETASGNEPADILAETPSGSPADSTPDEQASEPDQDQGAAEQGDHEQADDYSADTELASHSAPEQVVGTEGEKAPDGDAGPGRIYADGKEYEVSGNPRDGIWISGLPGEAPGTPEGDPYGTVRVGDMLSGEETEKGKFDKFADSVYEKLEDVSDQVEHFGETVQKFLDKPPLPTHTGLVHDHASANSLAGADHGLDGGHLVSATLALSVLGARLYQIHHERSRQKVEEGNPHAGQ